MVRIDMDAIRGLSVPERLALVEEIWQSIADEPDAARERGRLVERLIASLGASPEIGDAWTREVEKRLQDWEAGRLDEIPWDSVRAQVRERTGSA